MRWRKMLGRLIGFSRLLAYMITVTAFKGTN